METGRPARSIEHEVTHSCHAINSSMWRMAHAVKLIVLVLPLTPSKSPHVFKSTGKPDWWFFSTTKTRFKAELEEHCDFSIKLSVNELDVFDHRLSPIIPIKIAIKGVTVIFTVQIIRSYNNPPPPLFLKSIDPPPPPCCNTGGHSI